MPSRYPKRKRTTTAAAKAGKKSRASAERPAYELKIPQPPALDTEPEVGAAESQEPVSRGYAYSLSSLGDNGYHGDYVARPYVPTSVVSHISSFTGSEKEREIENTRRFYELLDAEEEAMRRQALGLAPEQGQKRKYDGDDDDDDDVEDDELWGQVDVTGYPTRSGLLGQTRPFESYSLKDAIESMAIVTNFLMEVNKKAAINVDDARSIKDAINYDDPRWDDKNVDWEAPIERAYTYSEETVARLSNMPILDFIDLAYALLGFSSNLYKRGIEIV